MVGRMDCKRHPSQCHINARAKRQDQQRIEGGWRRRPQGRQGVCAQPVWAAARLKCVTHGNFLKFSQNAKLRKILLQTGDLKLVEAAPGDRIWGIGRSVKDAARGASWQGQNLLGEALMAARAMIASGQKRFEAAPAAAEEAEAAPPAKKRRTSARCHGSR